MLNSRHPLTLCIMLPLKRFYLRTKEVGTTCPKHAFCSCRVDSFYEGTLHDQRVIRLTAHKNETFFVLKEFCLLLIFPAKLYK